MHWHREPAPDARLSEGSASPPKTQGNVRLESVTGRSAGENNHKEKETVMLVLSRKLNEKVVIDGGIVVTVVKIDRNQIRLGIEAPASVGVFREEIAGIARRSPARTALVAGI
jgi:carbon storage regulator